MGALSFIKYWLHLIPMKAHFTELYRYNRWANQLILSQLPEQARPLKLFAHVAAAQVIWLSRIKDQTNFQQPVWPEYHMEELKAKSEESDQAWLDFVQNYSMVTFEEVIRYQTTGGNSFETKLGDIITHVANHGTHHRAQISSLIREAGHVPPQTDFIFYCRTRI